MLNQLVGQPYSFTTQKNSLLKWAPLTDISTDIERTESNIMTFEGVKSWKGWSLPLCSISSSFNNCLGSQETSLWTFQERNGVPFLCDAGFQLLSGPAGPLLPDFWLYDAPRQDTWGPFHKGGYANSESKKLTSNSQSTTEFQVSDQYMTKQDFRPIQLNLP